MTADNRRNKFDETDFTGYMAAVIILVLAIYEWQAFLTTFVCLLLAMTPFAVVLAWQAFKNWLERH